MTKATKISAVKTATKEATTKAAKTTKAITKTAKTAKATKTTTAEAAKATSAPVAPKVKAAKKGKDTKVDVTATNSTDKLLEVCLILDCTASMSSWIERSKNTLKGIIKSV
jgi:hypothetical protein